MSAGIKACSRFEVRECDYSGDRRTIDTVEEFDTYDEAVAFYNALPPEKRARCHIQHQTPGLNYRQGKLPSWRFRPVKWARNAPKGAVA